MSFCTQNSNKDKYGSKFDQFMKQHQVSEAEKEKRQQEAEEELKKQSEAASQESERAQQKLKDTKKAFDTFSTSQGTDEMNIKDVFKNINLKEYTSEASKILNEATSGASKRVSSILEMRKKLFKQEKKEEVQKVVEEEIDKTQAEAQKVDSKEEKVAPEVDQAKDKATAEAEGAEERSEPEAQTSAEEKPKVKKDGAVKKLKSTLSSTAETINTKAPFLYKTGVWMKDLWKETFPSDDGKVKGRIQKRREMAQMQQKYSEEEIEQMQESIPDWKRTAVTVMDEEATSTKEDGYLKRLFKKAGSKVSDTSIGKKVLESEEYKEFKKKYREVKLEASEFKEDFKDEVETTQNPVVGSARTVGDYVFRETDLSMAIGKMTAVDPEFDVLDLTYEVEEIFVDMFNSYLEGDLEYLEKFWGEACLAVIKGEIQRRQKEGWEHKYKEMLFCMEPNLLEGRLGEDNKPRFTYTITMQDMNCKVSAKNPEEIVEGGENEIQQWIYKITVKLHDEADIAVTGHYWEIVEFERHDQRKQLV